MTIIWLYGRPCAGKTTLGTKIKEHLQKEYDVIHLDADEVRKTVNVDLKFTMKDREENVRRIAAMAWLLSKQVDYVIVSCITPTRALRDMVFGILGVQAYMVYVNASLEEATKRDVKKHYAKALAGDLADFTGISSVFEEPDADEELKRDGYCLTVDTTKQDLETCGDMVMHGLSL